MAWAVDHEWPAASRSGKNETVFRINREGPRKVVLSHKRCNELRGHANYDTSKRLMKGEAVTIFDLWPHRFRDIHFPSVPSEGLDSSDAAAANPSHYSASNTRQRHVVEPGAIPR